jgi:trehalose 6-phosphate phosphatase
MSPPLPLWNCLQEVMQRCLEHERCALLLDFDGTLAPIVSDPAAACPSPSMRAVLEVLARHPRYRLALISGRGLADLRRRIGDEGWYLAGNHGLEIEGPAGRYDHPEALRLRPQMTALRHELQAALAQIPGAIVEDKGLTLSVHYRQVPVARVPEVKRQVEHYTRPALESGVLVLRAGKAVLEIRPNVAWGKGEAVRWIIERLRQYPPTTSVLALYLGDDETDEDAFRALPPSGIGIVVGSDRPHSAARYCVDSVDDVERFLGLLTKTPSA